MLNLYSLLFEKLHFLELIQGNAIKRLFLGASTSTVVYI